MSASPFAVNIVSAQANAPIRIGFPVPLTGPFGTEAQDQVRCAGCTHSDNKPTYGSTP